MVERLIEDAKIFRHYRFEDAAKKTLKLAGELMEEGLPGNLDEGQEQGIFYHPNFTHFSEGAIVVVNGKEILLTPTENEVLTVLGKNPNRIVRYSDFAQIFGPGKDFEPSVPELVKFHIKSIRNKLEPKDRGMGLLRSRTSCIRTVRGVGYEFVNPSPR